ncbi:MAG: amino acid permease [Candidatus Pacebacteria bacterium]|nr:amino acid permease [Candidatus Paceibacterota bacterium]
MRFLRALFVFVGTIIGVGIFALPWATKEIGLLFTLLYFLILGILVILIHFLFAKVCCYTKEEKRFPGYVFMYLGKKWGNLSLFSTFFGLFGAQLAYLIVGGGFLYKLLEPFFGGRELYYMLGFFLLGGFLIFKGIKSVSLAEVLINIFFFALLLFLFIKTYNFINREFLSFSKFSFYPYGVILFSLWGSAIVPEVAEMLQKKEDLVKKVISLGVIFASLVYILFIVAVVGISGKETTQDALSGLSLVLGEKILWVGYLFGVITCFTSYLALGLTIKKIFWYDLKFNKNLSFLLATGIPLIFYFSGFKNFILVVSLCGAIAIGIEGFVHIFLYKKVVAQKFKQKINPLLYLLPIFLLTGVILQILLILT